MSTSITKLRYFLKEMFQFNENDLDFGIYKIYNLKRKQIEAFIDGDKETDLIPTIESILGEVSTESLKGDSIELFNFMKGLNKENLLQDPANNYGQLEIFISSETDERKKEKLSDMLRGLTQSDGITDELRDRIYNHVLGFFQMYYSNGDFGYNDRSRDVYKVPYEADYDGSDTLFHWKHKGSLYIKSATSFNAVTFELDGQRIEYRLETNAQSTDETTARNNNKDDQLKHYRLDRIEYDEAENIHRVVFNFSDSSTPKAEIFQKVFTEVFEDDTDLGDYLRYEDNGKQKTVFNDLTKDFDKVQNGQIKGLSALRQAKDKIEKAVKKNREWGAKLLDKDTEQFTDATLAALYTLDQKLNSFYIGHDADYFIHEDLHGFLTGEKERYVKNYIFDDLDAIYAGKLDNRTIIIAKAFDRTSSRIIDFLSAIEDFQKHLFTKKKKVVENEYCITLDYIDAAHYSTILANQAQLDEWKALFDVEVTTEADLTDHPTLTLDTAFFRMPDGTNPLKDAVLATIPDLHDALNGLLLNTENYQGLELIQQKYKEKVKTIYIDPPYNSGSDDFVYKDRFRNSSWLSMLDNRVNQAKEIMSSDGTLFSSIDDKDSDNKVTHRLSVLLERIFGKKNYVENLIWTKNTTHNDAKTFSHNHEYIQCFTKDKSSAVLQHSMFRGAKPGFTEVKALVERLNPSYPSTVKIKAELKKLYKEHRSAYKEACLESGLEWNSETKRNDPWKGITQYKLAEYRTKDGIFVNESEAKNVNAEIWVYREDNSSWPNANSLTADHKNPEHTEFRFYNPAHPATGSACPAPKTGWRWKEKKGDGQSLSFEELSGKNLIEFGENETKVPQAKRFLDKVSTNVVKSVISDYTDGEKELAKLVGQRGTFPNPKPTTLIANILSFSTTLNSYVLDFFAGSGTTGEAVLKQNRVDSKNRRYLLMEMGTNFNATLKPRIQKVIYSANWKDGKPQDKDGSPRHIFQYQVLEQYEDVLDNLEVYDGAMPEGLPIKYYYLPEQNALDHNLDLHRPFSNQMRYGRAGKVGYVDVVETYNYLAGYFTKSIKTYTIGGKYYRAVETTTGTLVLWRDIESGEDDSAAVLEIAAQYDDLHTIEVNAEYATLTLDKNHRVQLDGKPVDVRLVRRDIFNQ